MFRCSNEETQRRRHRTVLDTSHLRWTRRVEEKGINKWPIHIYSSTGIWSGCNYEIVIIGVFWLVCDGMGRLLG